MADFSILQGVLSGAGGGLIIKLIDYFANKSAKKDDRANAWIDRDLQEITSLASELRTIACAYWSIDGDEDTRHQAEAAMTGKLFYLGKLVYSTFCSHRELAAKAETALNSFDDSITGGDYRVSGRKADPLRLHNIETTCHGLIFECSRIRREL
ncbi:hypothetical protein [Pseudogemmobacter faecipullorum]|uniref:Uncharacterized protein n=1 Tax=Pseudogemmobacter faecipullorum TaxID=2755041 RepID=A0ABS8CS04_9RHOB|nr:hypothetical protein [Pseudogemmobacter faecipullorum]MCB5412180.1 hypothetical protein [Pseudogemmobacter faecipullorum]